MIDQVASALGFGSGWGAKALARAVGGEQRRVVALSEPLARALEHAGHQVVRAQLENGRLALDDGAADALCASGLPPTEVAAQVLAECARVVRPGGRVLVATPAGLTRRGPPRHVVCAAFLHAGLLGLEQRLTRGILVTAGTV
jgi:ubiquinone/menaquinone biosynthesis C-methylase UbiE